MLSFSGALRVFVAIDPCDMRKGFNGRKRHSEHHYPGMR